MGRRSAVAIAVVVIVTAALAFGWPDAVELPARDVAMRLMPRQKAEWTVVVAIDERSLREVAPWPWPRATLAKLIDRAADSGARGVVLDILLDQSRDGDAELARAMKRIPVIAVSVLGDNEQWLVPAPAIHNAATVAHGNFERDRDGILRRFATTKQSRDRSYIALPYEASMLIRVSSLPVGRTIAPAFRTRPSDIPVISAAEFFAKGANVRDKLVFVGPTELGFGDRVLTPVSRRSLADPGVTVHAAATESLVGLDIIHDVAPIAGGVLAGIIVFFTRSRRIAIAIATVIVIGGFVLLATTGIAIPFITLLVVVIGAIAAVETTRVRITATRLEEIATKLAERRAQEVESQRMLAHELKTPLASMRGLTQLLGGFELTEAERRRVASLLEAEAGKLQSMVHALLDLERLPLRDFEASSNVIDLGALARTRIDFLQASTERPLAATFAPDVFVRGDAPLIERVIDNLVGNAIKYTDSTVTIAVQRNAQHAELAVEDRGAGISDAERARIFQRFFRGTSAAGTEGLGLGLALVAEVAKWHGGSVSIERAPGGGSRFLVQFPLARAA